ncbi:TNFAIP3-interacting protein 3-like [Hypomesus transpacificus]|uniref:TNFAIP3-interacting protein 3-like n=1 Tax=Hypomesus transpacificus TaxID=137520 RepID=UPI001F07E535|nr:TNFAIP3-interacting protein 3-like [Hypomesus transpacificus]
MEKRRTERTQTDRPITGLGAPNTDRSHIITPQHRLALTPERCESVELDNSIRERVQSYLLTQDAPVRNDIQFKETQTGLSLAATGKNEDSHLALLEKQRQELLYINTKWAEQYQTMTQYYKQKVKDQEMLLMSHGQELEDRSEEEQQERKRNIDLPQTKDNTNCIQLQNDDISADLQRAEQETERLRVQNTTLTRRGQQQHGEIRRLNKVLKEVLQTTGTCCGPQEEVWRHQAQIYKEDFLKERRDREQLKGKHGDLEEKFRKVHTELNALKSKIIWTPTLPRPLAASVCPHQAHPTTQNRDARLRAHSPSPHTQQNLHL